MHIKKDILFSIKNRIRAIDPSATIILYGSVARGNAKPGSDIDLLILVEKDRLTYYDKTKLSNSLYEIEFATSQIISPLILSKSDWESRHKITPFYENISREGVKL